MKCHWARARPSSSAMSFDELGNAIPQRGPFGKPVPISSARVALANPLRPTIPSVGRVREQAQIGGMRHRKCFFDELEPSVGRRPNPQSRGLPWRWLPHSISRWPSPRPAICPAWTCRTPGRRSRVGRMCRRPRNDSRAQSLPKWQRQVAASAPGARAIWE